MIKGVPKNMKKIFLLLVVLLISSTLSSCEFILPVGKRDEWFDEETLQAYKIPDLPQYNLEDTCYVKEEGVFYFTTTKVDINEYIKLVGQYLLNNDQIYNLAIYDYDGFIDITEDIKWLVFKRIDSNYVFEERYGYVFVYSLNPDVNCNYGYDLLTNYKQLYVGFEFDPDTHNPLYLGFSYNANIRIESYDETIILS